MTHERCHGCYAYEQPVDNLLWGRDLRTILAAPTWRAWDLEPSVYFCHVRNLHARRWLVSDCDLLSRRAHRARAAERESDVWTLSTAQCNFSYSTVLIRACIEPSKRAP